jgi:hypothetical protein
MENPIDTSAPNRSAAQGWRLWFALGTGGLLLGVMGGLVAWLPWHRQVQGIAEIDRLGGYVETMPVGPAWLRGIVGDEVMAGYDDVRALHLAGTQLTNTGLVKLTVLTKLEYLDLSQTLVTDAGLVHLVGLTKLRHLSFLGTQVTDTAVADIRTVWPMCQIIVKD